MVTDGPASPWLSREFQVLEGACDVRRGSAFLPTRFNRPAASGGDSHESADTPE